MLANERTAVYAHDFATGEGFADDKQCLCIEFRLGVGGHQDGTVDDQEIGVCGVLL